MSKYLGITIGPIFDTIDEAVSPAGLWFASMLFSDISELLCGELRDKFKDCKILSPLNTQPNENMYGTYPDRIIVSLKESQTFSESKLKLLINEVIKEVVDLVKYKDKDVSEFIKEYLQINYVIFDSDNTSIGKIQKVANEKLNAIEWMKKIPRKNNIFTPLFRGDSDEKRHENIKNTKLVKDHKVAESVLCIQNNKDYSFKSIEDICKVNPEFKKSRYYAIVYADVDSLEDTLSTIENEEQMQKLSDLRSRFISKTTDFINEFGGITIYAGGDDLFFLSPVESRKGENIIKLCRKILSYLTMTFSKGMGKKFTMSFGVSIQYKKYPLYEAINNARHLLFDVCKAYDENGNKKLESRNSMAISFQKHSGTTLQIRISNDEIKDVVEQLEKNNTNVKDIGINSVIKALEYHKPLINKIDYAFIKKNELKKEDVLSIFDNYYDHESQQANLKYYHIVIKYYYDHILLSNGKFTILDEDSNPIDSLLWILKYKEFLLEGNKL